MVNDLTNLIWIALSTLFQLGDIFAQILYAVSAEGFGYTIPVTYFRIISIAISLGVIWAIFGRLGIVAKVILAIVVVGMVVSLLAGSPFNPCSILGGTVC